MAYGTKPIYILIVEMAWKTNDYDAYSPMRSLQSAVTLPLGPTVYQVTRLQQQATSEQQACKPQLSCHLWYRWQRWLPRCYIPRQLTLPEMYRHVGLQSTWKGATISALLKSHAIWDTAKKWHSRQSGKKVAYSASLACLHAAIVSKSLLMATCYYPVKLGLTASTACSALHVTSCFLPVVVLSNQTEEVLACFFFTMYSASEVMWSSWVNLTDASHVEESITLPTMRVCEGTWCRCGHQTAINYERTNQARLCLGWHLIFAHHAVHVCNFLLFCPCWVGKYVEKCDWDIRSSCGRKHYFSNYECIARRMLWPMRP